MILVDRALEQRERDRNPVRVAMVGAGFMARGIARQILNVVRGMELVAISNRRVEAAVRAFRDAGAADVCVAHSPADLAGAMRRGCPAVTDDPFLLCEAPGIDAIVEVTGSIEFGARVALRAIESGKHVILMNAELDSTLGPILKHHADRAGVVFTDADGDQPGVILNLYRFVKGLGVRPVLCGNIKGLHDPYRNPTTQEGFAKTWGMVPQMVTSFADGTKISFEQAIVANATGMRVAKRGMHGPVVQTGTSIMEAVNWYPLEELLDGTGIVDYAVGAHPAPGVFVLGTHDSEVERHHLALYKLGSGPLYCFYTPWHLCHFEVHNTVARAVLFGDAAVTPLGGPVVDVVTAAKVDLEAGQVLDGCGGYLAYGLAENCDVIRSQRLLPMGLAEGCRLIRRVPRDQVLTYHDVEVPPDRVADRLRTEQDELFGSTAVAGGSGEH